MKKKTSLTLDEQSLELMRDRAEREGIDMGHWLDRAVRHEAARVEQEILADWEASFSPEQKAVCAAIEAADRAEQGPGWADVDQPAAA